jgi:hypothetical protein
MTQVQEKEKDLKIRVPSAVHEGVRRRLYMHGELQRFFATIAVLVAEGVNKTTIGEVVELVREESRREDS